jgi:hypothetical protein
MQAYLAGVKFLLQRLAVFVSTERPMPRGTSLSPQSPQLANQKQAALHWILLSCTLTSGRVKTFYSNFLTTR